ncbi:hypothetical protein KDU71_09285 [Carboxylicivirga sediminis]|uniref:Sulfotransferase family protein n=1 Tax=Carboxylicivirga sediminis TaxID=2006564 RepID=A0A941F3H6_9BACT|nr:sulfotransferase [Carboxylicivirga sediminis]MBR8535747.1 hypothetical protein [Carboxylicivirga sediminis]
MLENYFRKQFHAILNLFGLFKHYATFKEQQFIKRRNNPKIFVIGFNKTGTTSVESALKEFDIKLGNQREAELLLDNIINDDFKTLFNYCLKAEAFQDIPFSLPSIFKILDQKFEGSKFILTVRDSDQQWFESLCKFHGKLWADGKTPTKADLANAKYIYKGYPLKVINRIFGDCYYEAEHYKEVYNKHNNDVIEYFKSRPNDLLVINAAEKESYKKMCHFIGKTPLRETFEWKNKTSEI